MNGYYFESGNADSLAKSIEYLLRNPQMMKAFGDVSLKNQEEINLDTVSSRFVEAFKNIIFLKIRWILVYYFQKFIVLF